MKFVEIIAVFGLGLIVFMLANDPDDRPNSKSRVSLSVDKVTLAINNMDDCKKFYAATLGLEFKPIELQGFTLYSAQTDDFEILLCPRKLAQVDKNIDNNTVQLRLVVTDIQSSFDQAMKNGGKKISAPQKIEQNMHAGLRDPDGNSLELVQKN